MSKNSISGFLILFKALMPKLEKVENGEGVYIFEELENNLHPALQRKLFNFLREWSVEYNATIFLTTHSNIPIDLFSGKDACQIVHLKKEGDKLITKQALNFLDNSEILFDLDVKASDILQVNGIIWVEGPSDRVYIKKWLDLVTNDEFIEGIDYQILFYGGRLLSAFSASPDDEEINDFIKLLKTNRNLALVMDSDKKTRTSRINQTKTRLKFELEAIGAVTWITKVKKSKTMFQNVLLVQRLILI